MFCPHCNTAVHESWAPGSLFPSQHSGWSTRYMKCPQCSDDIIELIKAPNNNVLPSVANWIRVHPMGSNRSVASDVPANIAQTYLEAVSVLHISAKASAALSRRCLQEVLHENGYVGRDLAAEIDMLLNENDPYKAIPLALRTTIDAIRSFGNFSAHPITDKTSLQVIDVDPEEAEWCLNVLDEIFEHFYVKPNQAKRKKEALNSKLVAARKPSAK